MENSLVDVLGGFMQDRYYQAAIVALLTYEQIASLGVEIKYGMWTLRGKKWLFLLNRLNMLVMWASFILGSLSQQNLLSCKVVLALNNATAIANLSLWAGFTTLRVYAVGKRSRWTASLAALLGLVPVAVNLYAIIAFRDTVETLPLGNSIFCITESSMSASISTRLSLIGRGSTIASDAIALFVIYHYLPNGFKRACKSSWDTDLAAWIWAYGTYTFAFLLTINLLDMILDAVNVAYGSGGVVFNPFSSLIMPITTICILRFTVHLRKAAVEVQRIQQAPTVISLTSFPPEQRSYASIIRWLPSSSMRSYWLPPASFGAIASVHDPELDSRSQEMAYV